MAMLALVYGIGGLQESRMLWLIVLAVGYFTCLNCIQPHWRAWMGSLVPQQRRGVFFAARTRLTMVASLFIFISGGAVLSITALNNNAWIGFALLFGVAAGGRFISGVLLNRMHDPVTESSHNTMRFQNSWRHVLDSL